MIERHVCYYKVNNPSLYRSVINAEGFDNAMSQIGIYKREIIELDNEEFKGVFDIDTDNHPNKGFQYFESKGITFSYTRPSEVSPVQAHSEMLQELDSIKSRLKQVA